MLTGDKMETAVNIGYSCGILNDNIKQIEVDTEDVHTLSDLAQYLPDDKYALVITGDALVLALHPPHLENVCDQKF